MPELSDYFNVREAAKRLSVNPETVRRWIWDGKLLATKLGNAWLIKRSELDLFENTYKLSSGKMRRLL